MNVASIIITTYKRPNNLIVRAIESALNQNTAFNFEVIIIDDNGKNTTNQLATQQIVSTFANKNIIYFAFNENQGACIARNKGIELATGKYLFFLDDDDEFLANKVEVQVKFLEKNIEFDGCLAAFKRKGNHNESIKSESNFPNLGNLKNFLIHGNFFTPMLCIKKQEMLKLGGFVKIDRFQDIYFMIHALHKGAKIATIDDKLHIMYEHSGERITNKSIDKSIKALNQIKNFAIQEKEIFNMKEWEEFLLYDLRKRAIVYYASQKYLDRIKGAPYFLKSFLKSRNSSDFIMMIKSIIRVIGFNIYCLQILESSLI